MLRFVTPSDGSAPEPAPPNSRDIYARIPGLRAVLGCVFLVGLTFNTDRPSDVPVGSLASRPEARAETQASVPGFPGMLDPRPALDPARLASWSYSPIPSALQRPEDGTVPVDEAAASAPPVQSPSSIVASNLARPIETVPLPVPRPPELRDPGADLGSRLAGRALSRRTRLAAVAAPQPDNRSFLEKLFGLQSPPAPTLAYAALESGPVAPAPAPKLSPLPGPGPEAGTAIYDIGARSVTLPNGEKLEAHSGLGEKLDDARSVHVRMRGATPPGTYDLTEREQLFHGVRALRLNPVGGSAAVFGRAGLLAHTYMLGPNGDSNGCVSFRDYERFLQAYLRGEIRRLVVVSGSAWNRPAIADRAPGLGAQPPARAGDA